MRYQEHVQRINLNLDFQIKGVFQQNRIRPKMACNYSISAS
jgi:hypothetical protein